MSLRRRFAALLESPRLPLWATLLAVALCLPSLGGGFVLDDHGLAQLIGQGAPAWDLFDFTRFGDTATLQERGFLGWWASPDFAIAFMRPLASLSHSLDFALWPGAAWAMHAHSVLLYGLLCGLVALIYRRLGTPALAAGLAALLFVVDDVHAQTAGWISGRNAILAAIPAFAALWAHHRWRAEGWRHGAWLGPLLLAVSLLSAEAGLACAGYLVAHATCLERGRWWRRLAVLLPSATVLALWQLAYRALGYGAQGSGVYLDAGAQPLTFVSQTFEHAWVLGLAQLSLPICSPMATLWWGWIVGAALLGALALALGPLLRRSALARFYAVGMLLSALPFGATTISDRLLLPLGFGASGLLAMVATAVRDGSLPGATARWTSRGLLLFAGVLSPLLFVPSLFLARLMEHDVAGLDAALPTEGTAVVVSVPFDILMLYPEARRLSSDRTWPETVYTLHGGLDTLEVNRCGLRCLMLQPHNGWLATPLDGLARGAAEPFGQGEVVALEHMSVRVTRVDADGRPEAAAFLFEQPLERIRFVTWVDGAPAPWEPPAIDQSVTLETRFSPGG